MRRKMESRLERDPVVVDALEAYQSIGGDQVTLDSHPREIERVVVCFLSRIIGQPLEAIAEQRPHLARECRRQQRVLSDLEQLDWPN